METAISDELHLVLDTIATDTESFLSWQWDGRFGAAVASFGIDNADKLSEILAERFSATYDNRSIGQASSKIRQLSDNLGGLREGQKFYCSELDTALLFGAWWPWGNQTTISIRIGIQSSSDLDKAIMESFKIA